MSTGERGGDRGRDRGGLMILAIRWRLVQLMARQLVFEASWWSPSSYGLVTQRN